MDKYDTEYTFEKAVSGMNQYNKNKVTHLVVNTLEDMVLITLVKDDSVKTVPWDLLTRDGVLAYVFNVSQPDFSELGYVFFTYRNGFIRRIG